LRRFSGRLAMGVLAIVGGYGAARYLGLKLPGEKPGPAPAVAPIAVTQTNAVPVLTGAGAEASGNALMTRVLATLENWPNVAARFRQSLRIGDRSLHGGGEYWQRGVGNQRLTCWQWQAKVGEFDAAFTQIYDKNSHLWTDSRFAESRTVTRVDVKKLRRELSLATDATAENVNAATARADELERLARGGLSQTVAELRRAFDFGPPTTVLVAGQSVVATIGNWKAEVLAQEWPGLSAASATAWPEHLPHHVVVKVGPKDYFPYVIEYRRGDDAALVTTPAEATDPLARFEFFEVRWAVHMADQLFEFTPSEVDWQDVTSVVLARLQPSAPPPPKPAELAGREAAPPR
jgi:hypothetical protein